MKKSFILYLDQYEPVKNLSLEQKGLLLECMFKFHANESIDIGDPVVDMAFSFFKQTFERDNKKYEKIVERNKNNGLKGGRPSIPKEPKKPTGLSGNPVEPKKADSDSDSDSVTGNDNKKNKEYTPEIKNFVDDFIKYISDTHPRSTPKGNNVFDNSYTCIRQLITIDKFSLSEVIEALRWAAKDTGNGSWSGWSNQVKSLAGLRKKTDGLTKFQKIFDAYSQEVQEPINQQSKKIYETASSTFEFNGYDKCLEYLISQNISQGEAEKWITQHFRN